jgi:superfamily II DNA or RNA helicase
MQKAILSNRLYVPKEYVSSYMLKKFTYNLSEDDPDYKEGEEEPVIVETYREFPKYYGFSRGNLGKIFEIFSDFDIDDQRSMPNMDNNLIWLPDKHLRTYEKDKSNQQEVVDEWQEYGYGQINAPCRFGKTLLSVYLTCQLKVKTLILAHQVELLNQMLRTFWRFTNVSELQDSNIKSEDDFLKNGKVVGYVKEWEDIEKFDVAVMPYQGFVIGKDADQWLMKYRDQWGAVFVDECFLSGAECYGKTINSINSYYRLGVSATPYRKDELHVIVEDVIGPVVTIGKNEQLDGDWIMHDTKFTPKTMNWVPYISALSKNVKRNDLIVKLVIKDLEAGHNIVIGLWRKEHIIYLTELLKAEGIAAESFHGSSKGRDKIMQRTISGETRVLVAMRKMLLGIDVPRWSCYYAAMPINNKYVFHQEMSRVRTPFKDATGNSLKPRPLVRLFRDGGKMSYAMFNTCKGELNKEKFIQINDDSKYISDNNNKVKVVDKKYSSIDVTNS